MRFIPTLFLALLFMGCASSKLDLQNLRALRDNVGELRVDAAVYRPGLEVLQVPRLRRLDSMENLLNNMIEGVGK